LTRPAWQHLLGIGSGLLLALFIGWITGRPGFCASVYLAAVVAWQARNLIRFEQWLRLRSSLQPPNMRGLWAEVVAIAHRLYQRKRFHKRRALTLLRELRRMTSAMPDGAILLGPTREILWFNPTASQWLELRRKLDYGIRIDNLIRQPEFVDYVTAGGKGPGPRIHMPSLGDRWFAFNLVTTSTRDLQLLLVRDVTNEARLEGMRRDFVANASHELRSPLTVVRGYLDSLAEDPALDAAWREPVHEMQRQSERMHNIVSDLLELSRLEAGHSDAETEPVDVGGMLSLMRREVLSRADHPAKFDLHLESDALLQGAESELHSVFQNLVTNAVKYTPSSGTVAIRYWTDGSGAHVAVSDTGIGIPAVHIPRLTERFYRVDAGPLAQTRRLGARARDRQARAAATRCQLEIVSEEGEGSTFTCHFPFVRVQLRERPVAGVVQFR
jgi:two-component system phosphate regulon sensor histidine kinase PhoR